MFSKSLFLTTITTTPVYTLILCYLLHTTSVQFNHSVVSDSTTPWTAAHQASLFITNSRSSLKLMSIELVIPSNHLILCCPLLLPPSIFPSIRVFFSEWVIRIRWPKYWIFRISASNEYSGLISYRMDWLDLLTVQGTLKSLLQHHSSKASVLQCSLWSNSHPYMTTGKTIALTWHCINSVEWITRLFVFSWSISSTFPTFFSYK